MISKFSRTPASAFIVSCSMAASPLHAAPAQPWPIQVTAAYSISFTGFGEVGKFNFQSRVNGTEYSVTGDADIKVPLIYAWMSKLSGSGKLLGEEPKPAAYTFNSQGKAIIGGTKHQGVRMSFRDSSVSNVSIVPPSSPGGAGYVPLRPENLKDALDPLTAVMVLSRAKGATPCGRRIPIFDGKQRFDLLMTSAGQQRVAEARPSGQPGVGYLCRVRYIPIAGYKNNEETRQLATNGSIQVALRPIPSANLLVPYRITVETKVGTATMVLQRMDIVTPGQKQIALVH